MLAGKSRNEYDCLEGWCRTWNYSIEGGGEMVFNGGRLPVSIPLTQNETTRDGVTYVTLEEGRVLA